MALEYEAVTADGHHVVTLTDTATRATTRRVFYGTPGRMVEGSITDIENSCAHYVYFDVEGSSYAATLSTGSCSNVMPGRFSLVLASGGSVAQGLTVLEVGSHPRDGDSGGEDGGDSGASVGGDGGASPDTFSYVCF